MDDAPNADQSARADQIQRLIQGYQFTQALRVAAELDIAGLLANGPIAAHDLAATTNVDAPSLERLLRALVSLGVFDEPERGVFQQNELSELLCREHPQSVRAFLLVSAMDHYANWANLTEVVRTGRTVSQLLAGTSTWESRARNPEANARFNDTMAEHSRKRVVAFLDAYDCSRFPTVVDVGGGNGALLAGILKANPNSRGILFDQPHVVSGAEARLSAAGVADRAAVVGGDFFQSIPSGGDAYIFSVVLHDWDDEKAAAILRHCHEAMNGWGELLLLERVLTAGAPDWDAHFMDMQMLQGTGGRERTEAEWREVLGHGGFRMERALPFASGEMCVVEAIPV